MGLLIIGGAFTTLFEGMEGFMKNLQDIVMLPFVIVAVLTVVVAGIRHSDFTKKHPYIQPFYTEEETDRLFSEDRSRYRDHSDEYCGR